MDTLPPDIESLAAQKTSLVSFVLRFVCDEPAEESARLPPHWRGVIRHVQSDAERHFTHWTEAVAFIARYIDVDKE